METTFFIYFPLFLLSVFLAFYIPGNIFVAFLKLSKIPKITLSINTGIVLWALQGFLFGYLHMRWLTYFYLIFCIFIWSRFNYRKFKFRKAKIVRPKLQHLFLAAFILFAVMTQLITSFTNGIRTSQGIYFCCGLPDTFFHIALTNELITNFPPHEPGISGIFLHNYHFLPNLVNADLIRIFHIPLLTLQYPYTSLLLTFLLALSILSFSQLVFKKTVYSYWLLFFVFFSGDLLFLLTFIQHKGINFSTEFLENASSLWISPPRIYGTTLLFTGLSFLSLWIKAKNNIILDILIIVLFGSLIGFKIYFGMFALIGFAALSIIYLKEKNKRKFFIIIAIFLLSFALYLPINSNAGGLIFTGLWRFNDFAANSVFGLQKMELARYVYLAHGNWEHAFLYTFFYFIIYFFFIFGTLLFAFFQTKNSLSLFDKKLHIFLVPGLLACSILGSFFIQKTGGANSAQFLITDMIMISIYTTLAVVYWLRKLENNKTVIILLSLVIIGFTIPRVVYEDSLSLTRLRELKGSMIDSSQLAALSYLYNNTPKNAIILQDTLLNCLYITFLAQRQTFICLDGAPNDRGVIFDKRVNLQLSIFKNNNKSSLAMLAHDKTIQYLYISTSIYSQREKVYKKYNFTKIFSNNEITIVKL